jgi:hypothetical protein
LLQCAARRLLAQPLEQRRDTLQKMRVIHGAAAINNLESVLVAEWQNNKKAV